MSKVEQAKYILVAGGRITDSGDDARVLIGQFALHNPRTYALVKPWRKHVWVDGVPGSIHNHEHCDACKTVRQRDGGNDNDPCKAPENIDSAVEMIEYHPPHKDDTCCPIHDHHVSHAYTHANCVLR